MEDEKVPSPEAELNSSTSPSRHELVSIITPVFNSEAYIDKAIKSVQDQAYTNWEMLVVADLGTTDRTPEIVQGYSDVDPRIKFIQVPGGRGLALSRNYAISLAHGRFLAFLDSDDFWLPQKLHRQIDFMRTNNYSFTCTAFRRIDVYEKRIGRIIEVPRQITYERLLQQNCIACLTVMLDTDQVGKVYFEESKHEDFILWLSLLKRGLRCEGLNEDLARYRIVDQSRSANKFESAKNTWRIYRDTEGLNLPQACLRLGQFAIRNLTKYSRF